MSNAPAGWYPQPGSPDLRYWDGSQWLDIPAPTAASTAGDAWDGDEQDPEYQAALAQARAEQKRVAGDGRPGRAIGWLAVLSGIAILIGGLGQQADERSKAVDQFSRAVNNLGKVAFPETIDPAYPVGFAMVGGFLVLVGVILIVGNRRRS